MPVVDLPPCDFAAWRREARALLSQHVAPDRVDWRSSANNGDLVFSEDIDHNDPSTDRRRAEPSDLQAARVPAEFLEMGRFVICHRDPGRFGLLYRILWRLTHREPALLHIAVDDDVIALTRMVRQVRRDRHKMTAFVRFRKIIDPAGGERFIAWYKPDHHILRIAVDHFVSRFGAMTWSILTPDESAHWDGRKLTFSPGVDRSAAPDSDDLEAMWRTYYASIFNPARIKLGAMRKEMPVRFWPTLPETAAIPQMLIDAPARVDDMIKRTRGGVDLSTQQIPRTSSLKVLGEAALACRVCPWAVKCTQTVFGAGPKDAPIVFVGEQPGDQEDLAGRPFVGPAGQVFADVLDEVGIDRTAIYVTNAVKHFKFEPRGKRRIHQKPDARDVAACRPWLMAELDIIRPPMLVCLGATAAQSLLGPEVRITKHRGRPIESPAAPWTMVTYHPSALLRAPDPKLAGAMRSDFTKDLHTVAKQWAAMKTGEWSPKPRD